MRLDFIDMNSGQTGELLMYTTDTKNREALLRLPRIRTHVAGILVLSHIGSPPRVVDVRYVGLEHGEFAKRISIKVHIDVLTQLRIASVEIR